MSPLSSEGLPASSLIKIKFSASHVRCTTTAMKFSTATVILKRSLRTKRHGVVSKELSVTLSLIYFNTSKPLGSEANRAQIGIKDGIMERE